MNPPLNDCDLPRIASLMKPTTLVDEFEHYSAWRDAVYVRVEALRDWLNAQELGDAESEMRLNQLPCFRGMQSLHRFHDYLPRREPDGHFARTRA